MYILEQWGQHVLSQCGGNKEGMAPKVPDPSYRRNLCVVILILVLSVFVPTFHHYAVPCVIVLMILCSSPGSSQSTLQRIDSWPEVSYWREHSTATSNSAT